MTAENFEQTRQFLQENTQTYDQVIEDMKQHKEQYSPTEGNIVSFLPILHNKNVLLMQFYGYSINLNADGTWIFEDTAG